MILLALEVLFLTSLAFAGGVFAGRLAYSVSARAAAAASRSVTAAPELETTTAAPTGAGPGLICV